MNSRIISSIVIGIVVITVAFFSAFGKDTVSRLSVDIEKQVTSDNTNNQSFPEVQPAVVVQPQVNTTMQGNMTDQGMGSMMSGYTLGQISSHNSATSCYSAINGEVYDLTQWVNSHPGGRMTILMICGKDGSSLFNTQHRRSNRVSNILAGFYIGNLN